MIERYFPQANVLLRLRSGPIGPYLPRFVSILEQRGGFCTPRKKVQSRISSRLENDPLPLLSCGHFKLIILTS
jgi:hypothetical protein